MFSDYILEKILGRDEVQRIPLSYKSTMIHVIEEVLVSEDMLKEEGQNEQPVYE